MTTNITEAGTVYRGLKNFSTKMSDNVFLKHVFAIAYNAARLLTSVNLVNQAMKNQTILVLNSENGWKPAMLINSAGEQKELACFDRDATTEAEFSCSVNWNNEFFIFGGKNEKRQISRLTGHKLKRIGDLTFDHYFGACSVMVL